MQAMPGRPAPPPPVSAIKVLANTSRGQDKISKAPLWTAVTSLPGLYRRGWRGQRKNEEIEAQRAWIVTVIVCAIGAILRLLRLGSTRKLIFDETYYVKDAYSLWHFGYETNWPKGADTKFISGDFSSLSADPAFVVHPPLGKWIIGLGMKIFGWSNPFGWRIAAAICGIIVVYLTCRLAWALFNSWILTGIAGMFVATDGVAISLSRVGLLDGILAAFCLAGVLCVVYDQQQVRERLSRNVLGANLGNDRVGVRWWLVLAGVWLGYACAVKWSGLYLLAVCGVFVFARDLSLRLSALRLNSLALSKDYPAVTGKSRAWLGAIVRGGLPAFGQLVVVAIAVYFANWWNWFAHPKAWGHGKTAAATGHSSWLDPISDYFTYMSEVMKFHTGVTSKHPYQSYPWQWLINQRPTSMLFEKPHGDNGDFTVEAMSSLGNPMLWWVGVIALAVIIYCTFVRRDWRAGVILVGYLGLWAPWLLYWYRTIFMFYMVVSTPFVALAVTYMIGLLLGQLRALPQPVLAARDRLVPPKLRTPDIAVSMGIALVIVILLVAAFFYPVVSGMPIPYSHWGWRMWFSSWI